MIQIICNKELYETYANELYENMKDSKPLSAEKKVFIEEEWQLKSTHALLHYNPDISKEWQVDKNEIWYFKKQKNNIFKLYFGSGSTINYQVDKSGYPILISQHSLSIDFNNLKKSQIRFARNIVNESIIYLFLIADLTELTLMEKFLFHEYFPIIEINEEYTEKNIFYLNFGELNRKQILTKFRNLFKFIDLEIYPDSPILEIFGFKNNDKIKQKIQKIYTKHPTLDPKSENYKPEIAENKNYKYTPQMRAYSPDENITKEFLKKQEIEKYIKSCDDFINSISNGSNAYEDDPFKTINPNIAQSINLLKFVDIEYYREIEKEFFDFQCDFYPKEREATLMVKEDDGTYPFTKTIHYVTNAPNIPWPPQLTDIWFSKFHGFKSSPEIHFGYNGNIDIYKKDNDGRIIVTSELCLRIDYDDEAKSHFLFAEDFLKEYDHAILRVDLSKLTEREMYVFYRKFNVLSISDDENIKKRYYIDLGPIGSKEVARKIRTLIFNTDYKVSNTSFFIEIKSIKNNVETEVAFRKYDEEYYGTDKLPYLQNGCLMPETFIFNASANHEDIKEYSILKVKYGMLLREIELAEMNGEIDIAAKKEEELNILSETLESIKESLDAKEKEYKIEKSFTRKRNEAELAVKDLERYFPTKDEISHDKNLKAEIQIDENDNIIINDNKIDELTLENLGIAYSSYNKNVLSMEDISNRFNISHPTLNEIFKFYKDDYETEEETVTENKEETLIKDTPVKQSTTQNKEEETLIKDTPVKQTATQNKEEDTLITDSLLEQTIAYGNAENDDYQINTELTEPASLSSTIGKIAIEDAEEPIIEKNKYGVQAILNDGVCQIDYNEIKAFYTDYCKGDLTIDDLSKYYKIPYSVMEKVFEMYENGEFDKKKIPKHTDSELVEIYDSSPEEITKTISQLLNRLKRFKDEEVPESSFYNLNTIDSVLSNIISNPNEDLIDNLEKYERIINRNYILKKIDETQIRKYLMYRVITSLNELKSLQNICRQLNIKEERIEEWYQKGLNGDDDYLIFSREYAKFRGKTPNQIKGERKLKVKLLKCSDMELNHVINENNLEIAKEDKTKLIANILKSVRTQQDINNINESLDEIESIRTKKNEILKIINKLSRNTLVEIADEMGLEDIGEGKNEIVTQIKTIIDIEHTNTFLEKLKSDFALKDEDLFNYNVEDLNEKEFKKLEKVKELFLTINEQIQPEIIFSLKDLEFLDNDKKSIMNDMEILSDYNLVNVYKNNHYSLKSQDTLNKFLKYYHDADERYNNKQNIQLIILGEKNERIEVILKGESEKDIHTILKYFEEENIEIDRLDVKSSQKKSNIFIELNVEKSKMDEIKRIKAKIS